MDTQQPMTSGNGESISIERLFNVIDNHADTVTDYANAIVELIKLADWHCGGSRAAAQVVLSLYNGDNWQLDLTDLCVLDDRYFAVCMVAITGRRKFGIEPHQLIKNGQAVFDRLQDEWKRYHVKNRNRNRK